jgi:hypothetical protein
VLPQIGIDAVAAAPERDVQEPAVAAALVVGGEFAMGFEAVLAQQFPGPFQPPERVRDGEAEQSGRYGEFLGLDLRVPQKAAGGLR